MWICDNCGLTFDEPVHETVAWEQYYGVGSLFSNYNYGAISVCPCCGSEDIEEGSDEWAD